MTDMTFGLIQWDQTVDKFQVWKQYVSGQFTVLNDMKLWFGMMAISLEPSLQKIGKLKEPTHDVRYLDQFYQMKQSVQDLQQRCQHLIQECHFCMESCAYQHHYHCYTGYWDDGYLFITCTVLIRQHAKSALIMDVQEVIQGYLVEWISSSYYLWKLCQQNRLSFAEWVNTDEIPILSLNEMASWEVICEDEEKEILCHPCLSHPMDFLERQPILNSHRYVDKARFEYQIPHTLLVYSVVFTKRCSTIPILTKPPKQDHVVCVKTKPSLPQVHYQETTTRHKHHHKPSHKKRKLSKILKEQRKKQKTSYRRHSLCQSFPIHDENDYHDITCDSEDECDSYYDQYFYQW